VIAIAALLGYAAVTAWFAPALLAPLTRPGVSVRAGLAAWLAAGASVLASAAVAAGLSVAAVAAEWPALTRDVCQSVAGQACTPQVYGSILYQLGVAVLAVLLLAASGVALCRYGRRVTRSRAGTRSHAQAALLVGRALDGLAAAAPGRAGRARTVTLDDPRPAAYCAAGRPAAIVVTSGALAVLDPPQLRAVLAHEHAHLAQRHHCLTAVTRALAAALPVVPLFTRGAAEVARLAEMAADDAAARGSGRSTLAAALLSIGTGAAVSATRLTPAAAGAAPGRVPLAAPAGSLPAAASALPDRVERLLRPPAQARAAVVTAALCLALSLLAAAPLALTLLTPR
jgi:Zn-dependent protease with chaperone function